MERLRNTDIKFLRGMGPKRAELLEKNLGIKTYYDLLYHFPSHYVDRTTIRRIADFECDDMPSVQVRGKFVTFSVQGEGAKTRLVGLFSDGSGVMEVVWFQRIKFLREHYHTGTEYVVFGKPSRFNGRWSMVHPEVDPPGAPGAQEGFRGVYPLTEQLRNRGFSSRTFSTAVSTILGGVSYLSETLPPHILARHNLMGIREALSNIHSPVSTSQLERARLRLKFEELFYLQLDIQRYARRRTCSTQGFFFPRIGRFFNTFYNDFLPFPLTGAQKRVVREVRADMATGRQMNRLLQGDVGSGKTMVALMSMLLAVDNGYQAAIMAPTEILARQHYASMSRMTEGMNLRIAILTGSSKTKERREALERTAAGEVDILVGTHALIEDKVAFRQLGYVVIDEQHRFGVEQRARLWTKNEQPPHILVMTATLKMFGFLRDEIRKRRQVYIVYPLIKESETMDYKDLYDGFESISRDFPLPEYRITVCHGKMKAEDKEAAMAQFKRGEADILIATSVIEVGVDVPNATVMVIESAERFGLSQLHQLRGRVGRGGEQSYCILMSGDKLSKEARARLDAMCQTNDGFRLAELDLKLRGAGDMHGTQQSGETFDLKIADLAADTQIMQITRDEAVAVLSADIDLSQPEHAGLRRLRERYRSHDKMDFSQIS